MLEGLGGAVSEYGGKETASAFAVTNEAISEARAMLLESKIFNVTPMI